MPIIEGSGSVHLIFILSDVYVGHRETIFMFTFSRSIFSHDVMVANFDVLLISCLITVLKSLLKWNKM